jgi:hypothetical protein
LLTFKSAHLDALPALAEPARSALAVTDDVDALTLRNYGLRLTGRQINAT